MLFGEVFPENSSEIGQFFCEFDPKNPSKFDFFLRDLSEALVIVATLGTEESVHCREVETRVNVWTVCQKNCCCGEVAISGGSTVVSAIVAAITP